MHARFALIGLVVAATWSQFAGAATCPDRTPTAITTVAAESLECQEAIAKAGAKFLKTKLKALAKCKLKLPAGSCPTADDTQKIEKGATKSAETIAKACVTDTVQAGLTSSYNAETDDAVISSCMLSQHNVVAELISAESHGPTTEPWPGTGKERADCVKQLSKLAITMFDKALENATKCVAGQMKDGVAGNLAPVCLGSWSGGVFTPPSDVKTQEKQAKLVTKIETTIAEKCGPAEMAGDIETLFACPGAKTIADLQNCIVCGAWTGIFDVAAQQYSETGTFVDHGPGAFQAAVSAAAPNAKLLFESGDYQEEVSVTTDGLQLVGCGGATNDRPRIIPPVVEVTGRGILANGVDGLYFQSLDFFNQANDHIRVVGANGVTFRDITGDGNRTTAYAVFPILSDGVLIELCKVRAQDDAPLYVGQSINIVVRHNDVREGVAGIEIENSANAEVFGNYGAGNTAGILVFKDGSLPVQLSQCHEVHHNLFENNNEPNFGEGTVAGVPTGTGMLVISTDTTPFHHNISRGNDSFGLALVDQQIAEFGPPFSDDTDLSDNFIFDNILTGNGTNPDMPAAPFGADFAFLSVAPSTTTCEANNTVTMPPTFSPALPTCTLPPPASFPGCPAGFPTTTIATTTTTTTSTTVTTMTTTTMAGPVSFSAQVQPIFSGNCAFGGCHAPPVAENLNLSAGMAYGNLVGVASMRCSTFQRVAAGDPSNSYLIFKLQGSGLCFFGMRMPLNADPLPPAQIQTISDWIAQGALNN